MASSEPSDRETARRDCCVGKHVKGIATAGELEMTGAPGAAAPTITTTTAAAAVAIAALVAAAGGPATWADEVCGDRLCSEIPGGRAAYDAQFREQYGHGGQACGDRPCDEIPGGRAAYEEQLREERMREQRLLLQEQQQQERHGPQDGTGPAGGGAGAPAPQPQQQQQQPPQQRPWTPPPDWTVQAVLWAFVIAALAAVGVAVARRRGPRGVPARAAGTGRRAAGGRVVPFGGVRTRPGSESPSMRPDGEAEGKAWAAAREAIMDDGTPRRDPPVYQRGSELLILDSNVLLRCAGYFARDGDGPDGDPDGSLAKKTRSGELLRYLLDNVGRVRIPVLVQQETEKVLRRRGTPEMAKKLEIFFRGAPAPVSGSGAERDGCVFRNARGYRKFLAEIDGIQRRIAEEMPINESTGWLYAKQKAVEDKLGARIHPGAVQGDEKREAMRILYEDARQDRDIIARACALAAGRAGDGGAFLVSGDNDILFFADDIGLISGGRLHAVRPAQLLPPGDGEDGPGGRQAGRRPGGRGA